MLLVYLKSPHLEGPTTMQNLMFAGQPVSALACLWDNPRHRHNSQEDRSGYILRQTQRDGVWLWHDEAKSGCGEDVAVFEGATSFGKALDVKRAAEGQDQFLVIDSVYSCGCRTGKRRS